MVIALIAAISDHPFGCSVLRGRSSSREQARKQISGTADDENGPHHGEPVFSRSQTQDTKEQAGQQRVRRCAEHHLFIDSGTDLLGRIFAVTHGLLGKRLNQSGKNCGIQRGAGMSVEDELPHSAISAVESPVAENLGGKHPVSAGNANRILSHRG